MDMKPIAVALAMLIPLLAVGGCSHQLSGGPVAGVDMARYRTYYVVTDKKDNEVAQALEKDLAARGFSVSTGLDWAMPPATQVKVLFTDKWMKDLTRYLSEVKIDMIDPHSGALLASGRCDRSSMARKPVAEMVKEITDRIYPAPPPSSSPSPPR